MKANSRILGVLAGNDLPTSTLVAWSRSADTVIAADGAANLLFEDGISPQIIVGDMDSLASHWETGTAEYIHDEDQETTDCDKLLALVGLRFPGADLTLVGLEGDRFDHVLASLHSVARSPIKIRIIFRDGYGYLVRPGMAVSMKTTPGQRVSLIPIETSAGVSLQGVRWKPNETLSPLGFTSISNEASADQVIASIQTGICLLLVQEDIKEPIWD